MSKNKKRLSIVVASPLTENIYKRIGARELSAYFEVTVIDCFDWLYSGSTKPVFLEKAGPDIYKAADLQAFKQVTATVSPDFVLDFVGRGASTATIQDVCRSVGALYITHHLVPFPSTMSRDRVWSNLVRHPLVTGEKVLGYLARKLTRSDPTPPDIALLAGNKSANAWVSSANSVIYAGTPGYYEVMDALERWNGGKGLIPELGDRDYILFIDDCLALSFDFGVAGIAPIIDADEYFPMLNRYFDRLERITGMPIVIAAHPNGKEYPDYAELFAGRSIYFDRTPALSYGCALALTHYSSAINYPVLLRRPVNCITFDALERTSQGRSLELISSILKRPALDMSAKVDGEMLRRDLLAPINEDGYGNYQMDYIINTPSPGSHPFENLARHLCDLP